MPVFFLRSDCWNRDLEGLTLLTGREDSTMAMSMEFGINDLGTNSALPIPYQGDLGKIISFFKSQLPGL